MATSKVMKVHPAAAIFPALSGKEYEEFRADIEVNGLIEPIWTYKGEILDGRNRYRACQDLKIKPRYRAWDGDYPIAFVVSANLHRRQLNAGQRAFIAVQIEELEAIAAKERMIQGGKNKGMANLPPPEKGKARDKAAAAVGASPRYVQDAKRIAKTDPEVAEKVKNAEITMAQARKLMPPKLVTKNKKERIELIREMAAEGNRANQIAETVGISVETVRKLARENNTTLPDATIGRSRKINEKRIIETTVDGLAGYALGLKTLPNELTEISADEAREWLDSLSRSLRVMSQLKKSLQEKANGS